MAWPMIRKRPGAASSSRAWAANTARMASAPSWNPERLSKSPDSHAKEDLDHVATRSDFVLRSRRPTGDPRTDRCLCLLRRPARFKRPNGALHPRHSLRGVHERQGSEAIERVALA